MKNQKYTHADHIAVTTPTGGVNSGQPLRVGALAGVAVTTQAEGERVALWLDGSYEFTVDFAVNAGDPVYITSGNVLTGTATGNTVFGHSLTTKAAAAGPVRVRIAN